MIREDGDGLYVEAVFVDTEAGREMRELIRSGAIDGMSFKFSVVKDEWEESTPMPVRTLREVRLYELGPVTFPSYEATTIGVRSREAFELWKSRSEFSGDSDAADSGTSEEPSDTPPAVAHVGVHRKRAAHARRKLGRRFPEIEGVEG